MRRRREFGFTLVEVLIALAVSSGLLLAMSVVYVDTLSRFKRHEMKSYLDQDSVLLTDYLGTELQNIGGWPMRAWQAVWVENNCSPSSRLVDLPACDGSDRITLLSPSAAIGDCAVIGSPSANRLKMESVAGVCCVTPSFANQQAALTRISEFNQVFVKAVDLAACEVEFTQGQSRNPEIAGASDWTGGVLSRVDVKTIFVDHSTRELKTFSDLNNNGRIDSGELTILAARIYDIQVAEGFDFLPADGALFDDQSLDDEWLFNSPLGIEKLGFGTFLTVGQQQLRMLQMGLIVGAPRGTGGAASAGVRVLDGPLRTAGSLQLKAVSVKSTPRNTYVFR